MPASLAPAPTGRKRLSGAALLALLLVACSPATAQPPSAPQAPEPPAAAPASSLAVAPAPPPVASPPAASAPAPPAIAGERGDLPLFTLDGKPTKLSAVGARVTVISIWGTFCVPCMKELPYVDALYQAVKGNPDVSVFTLVIDDHRDPAKQRAASEIATRLKLTVPVLFDEDIRLYKRLNGEDTPGGKVHTGIVVPQLVIIDPGFAVRRTMGFRVDMPVEQFVSEQRVLIDLAARGRLPPEDAPRSNAPSPAGASLSVPAADAPEAPWRSGCSLVTLTQGGLTCSRAG